MRPPLLDTHAWIWYVEDRGKLPAPEIKTLNAFRSDDRPFLSDFSLWEIATLVNLRRLTLDRPLDQWLDLAARPAVVRTVPISPAVALEISRLPDSFHRDPADRTLVATARALRLPVLTRDRKIIDSGLVELWLP